jgi:hypothetical protein
MNKTCQFKNPDGSICGRPVKKIWIEADEGYPVCIRSKYCPKHEKEMKKKSK